MATPPARPIRPRCEHSPPPFATWPERRNDEDCYRATIVARLIWSSCEVAREVLVALRLNAALARPVAGRRAFAVRRVQTVHDRHAPHDLANRREAHAVEPAVVRIVDEQLSGARVGPCGREAQHAARVVLAHGVVRDCGVTPGGGHFRVAVNTELRHEAGDHAEEPR